MDAVFVIGAVYGFWGAIVAYSIYVQAQRRRQRRREDWRGEGNSRGLR